MGIAPTSPAAMRLEERRRRLVDPPRFLGLVVLLVFVLAPVVVPSFQLTDLLMRIALFATLAASYDVVIGYTGIVSFGHVMFFGLGAYAVALSVGKWGAPTYGHLVGGLAAGIAVAAAVAGLIGAFSLRVKALFFAMITLAFAEFALILAVQLSGVTGGEDGVSPRLPGVFAAGFSGGEFLGIAVSGRLVSYYGLLAVCLGLFAAMSRFVHSPLGRALPAIRDNELRAEALGYRTFVLQIISSTFASAVAAAVGGCYTAWVRYVNPESTLGIPLMLDVLLMVIIGGLGTLYGGLVGAALLLTARTLLPDLRGLATWLAPQSEILGRLSERWLLYFGILFILVVFFFPRGVIGTIRERWPGSTSSPAP
ncbi:MAG TPA: branched-chain amino acid ABC transporter permease [Candidatus Methylomirabilis sp.]|nr:branched-chain amino acid ABC transporter permease [Candidatus Methylomirabilis sp.]